MTCLHIISGDLWAGAEVSVFHTLSELRLRPDVSLMAIVLNEGVLSQRLRDLRVPTEVLDEKRSGPIGLVRESLKVVAGTRVDIVHTHRYKENLIGAIVAARKGAHHIRTVHGLPPQMSLNGRGIPSGIAAACDEVIGDWLGSTWIAVSKELSRLMRGTSRVVHFVPNGLPSERPKADRESLETAFGPGAAWYVGFVGRLESVKRPDRFLRIVNRLPRRHAGREIRAVLIGDGSLSGELKASVGHSGEGPTVRFMGHRSHGEELLAGLDVLVLTSDHEGLPMVLLEAMRSEVAIAGTAVGGVPEVVGSSEWFVAPEDEAGLARAILRLLGAPAGDQWKQELHRRFEEEFTITHTVNRLMQVYRAGHLH